MVPTDKLIVNFAPTGMIPTKAMTPHVPVTVAEIIQDVYQAVEIGITMVHLHARDQKTGLPTYHADIYGTIIEGIRAFAPELIICVSTSGRTYSEFEKRANVLTLEGNLKPDMASLTLSSVNFNAIASVSAPDTIQSLALEMQKRGIAPELEAFDAGMINYAKFLHKKDVIAEPFYFNLIMGNIACAQADLLHAGVMIRDLPENSYWSFGGIGRFQLMMNSIAIASGGGVRVGLEDDIWYDRNRTRLASNTDLLKRIKKIAEANEREIMPPAELRKHLMLNDGHAGFGRK